jgi:hypothetical protein
MGTFAPCLLPEPECLMSDDNHSRYRSSDPYDRPNGPASDPLAELARLIGQNEPFADLGRDSRAAPSASPIPSALRDPFEDTYRGADSDQDQRYSSSAPPLDWLREPSAPSPRAIDDLFPAQTQPSSDSAGYRYDDRYEPPAADRYASDPSYPASDPSYASRNLPGFDPAPSLAPPEFDFAAQERFGAASDITATNPQDDGLPMVPPADDQFYDDAPQSGRKKGLVTVAAVLALAVVGTAAAFGYRSLSNGPKSVASPPVIRASSEPSKVAVAPVNNDASAKLSFDRFGDRSQNEQVVVREERPVDTRELGRASAPRVVHPGGPVSVNAGGASTAPVAISPPQTTAASNPPSAIGEPRRVRTLQIRPDQPEGLPQTAAPPPETPREPVVAAAPARARTPAPAPVARPNPPQPLAQANAPLSLSPDGSSELPPPGARMASAPVRIAPPPGTPQPTRVASTSAIGGGGYLVQVSSQRSEADAQAAYRSLRSRYSNVLGDHSHVIRRADLGSKGVYYRAMVGPFASRDQAIQVCGNLKAAGGDCVVQAN